MKKLLFATLTALTLNAAAWDGGYKYPLCVKWPDGQAEHFQTNESGDKRLWLRENGQSGPQLFGYVLINGEACKIKLIRFSGRENLSEHRQTAAKTIAAELTAIARHPTTFDQFEQISRNAINRHLLVNENTAEQLARDLALIRANSRTIDSYTRAALHRLRSWAGNFETRIGYTSVSDSRLVANCPSQVHQFNLKALPSTPKTAHFLQMQPMYKYLEPAILLWIEGGQDMSDPSLMICPTRLIEKE